MRNPRRQPLASPAGFTLFELLLVMVILAVMVAIVAPSLTAFAVGRRAGYAGIQIVALAKYARAEAINEGRSYRLNFDASNRPAVWLTVQQAGTQFGSPGSSWGNRVELADGLTLRTDLTAQPGAGTYVEFHPDGRTGDGPVHVWVSDKSGRVIELACQSPTELFRVLPPEETTTQ